MPERRSFKEPTITNSSRPHWEGALEGKLRLQQCDECEQWVHYPSAVCDRCTSLDLTWRDTSGLGTVESFSTVYRAFSPDFQDDVPYTVALVHLDEGPNLLTWLADVAPEDVRIGMPVEVTHERISDEIALHRFRPRAA